MKYIFTLFFLIPVIYLHAQNIKSAKMVTVVGRRISYDLYVNDTTVNYTGKQRHAIAINGQIPGPTIELTEGDTAVIRVHNLMNAMTSVHWHGILIPNQYDGVPGLTSISIMPGKTFEVLFPVVQNGTYWYHSHTMTQEQIGLTGSVVIHKRNEPKMKEQLIVLNDWTDLKPAEVWRLLKRRTDWFSIQKNSVQSYGEALAANHFNDKLKQEWMRMPAMDISDVKYNQFHINGTPKFENDNYKAGDTIKLRIINSSSSSYFWIQFAGGKMKVVAADGQDVVPVDVDKFLIATAETYDIIVQLPATGKYELRATVQDISGYTSAFLGNGNEIKAPAIPKIDYFNIMSHMNKMMSGMNMKMGVSDGPMKNMEVKNDEMDGMDMNNMSGMKMADKKDSGTMNDMNMSDMNMDNKKDSGSMKDMDMSGIKVNDKKDDKQMDVMNMKDMKMDKTNMGNMMNMEMYAFSFPPGNGSDTVLSYKMLQAKNDDPAIPTPTGKPDRIIELTATGNMLRYVWSFNNVTLTDADKILIKKGEHVRVIFHNSTMMEHPLHLHGHFFRLLNGTSLDEAPLKHTFNLLPMQTDTIDFAADEEKDWFFHCHTLYHMMSGMARTFHYDNTLPEVQKQSPPDYKMFLKEHGRHTFFWANTEIQSQGNFGNATLTGTKWELNEEWNYDWKRRYESETMFRRFIDKRQFLTFFIGADNRIEKSIDEKDGHTVFPNRNVATLGATYLLPLFVMAEGRVDSKGKFRLQLSRQDIEITRRVRLNAEWNTDKEYTLGLKYRVARNFAFSGSYDSDYGWGTGISLVY